MLLGAVFTMHVPILSTASRVLQIMVLMLAVWVLLPIELQ
jgi:hypothetical protein